METQTSALPKSVPVVAAVLCHQGRYLVARKKEGSSQAGLWEFPGGKVQEGETPEQALQREILEELGFRIAVDRPLASSEHHYPGMTILLQGYLCSLEGGSLILTDHSEVRWLALEELSALSWAPADLPLVRALEALPRPEGTQARTSMEKLQQGVVGFMSRDFEEHRELFSQIGRDQTPHTLFIGCADSRVVPNLITRTLPGELFVVRNIANIVPRYRLTSEFVSTTSAIEFAVEKLRVENIVVCGHSNCGGLNALYQDEASFATLPHTRRWLSQLEEVRAEVERQVPATYQNAREWLTEQVNIVAQMKNLLTYPFIAERVASGSLTIHGWHYIIESGEVFSYNIDAGRFELINTNSE